MSIFDMGGYGEFIGPAYAVSVIALLGITFWTLAGWYKSKVRLAALERK